LLASSPGDPADPTLIIHGSPTLQGRDSAESLARQQLYAEENAKKLEMRTQLKREEAIAKANDEMRLLKRREEVIAKSHAHDGDSDDDAMFQLDEDTPSYDPAQAIRPAPYKHPKDSDEEAAQKYGSYSVTKVGSLPTTYSTNTPTTTSTPRGQISQTDDLGHQAASVPVGPSHWQKVDITKVGPSVDRLSYANTGPPPDVLGAWRTPTPDPENATPIIGATGYRRGVNVFTPASVVGRHSHYDRQGISSVINTEMLDDHILEAMEIGSVSGIRRVSTHGSGGSEIPGSFSSRFAREEKYDAEYRNITKGVNDD
jgi:hypothetical protein